MSQQKQQKGQGKQGNKQKGGNQQTTKPAKQPPNPNQAKINAQRELRKPGYVWSVPSGDTVVILAEQTGSAEKAPREIQLTLLGLKAPLLGKKAKTGEIKRDEAFAWESREFLRNLLVGKAVVYRVEHDLGPASNRCYGDLWVDSVNVRTLIVGAGWAEMTVRETKVKLDKEGKPLPPREPKPEDQALFALMEESKTAHKGMWKFPADSKQAKKHIRNVRFQESSKDDESTEELLQFFERCKGRSLTGVVEKVRSGSSLKIYLNESQDEFTLNLAGIHAPSYRFNDDLHSDAFAREAKFFTEFYLLNREVVVNLDAFDKTGNFYGTLSCPSQQINISEELVKHGLANVVEWTASAEHLQKLQALEKAARDSRLKVWKKPARGGNNTQSLSERSSNTSVQFTGVVVEVITASTFVVRVQKSDGIADVNVTLSTIRVPRLPQRENAGAVEGEEEEEAPAAPAAPASKATQEKERKAREAAEAEKINGAYAREGREFLRKELIGKKVVCVQDYLSDFKNNNNNNSNNNNNNNNNRNNKPPRPLYSVYVGKNNVAVRLVRKGLANVSFLSESDPRSADYKEMVLAEKLAEKEKLGLFAPKSKAPVNFVNDLSFEGEAKCRQFLGTLQRIGRLPAVVEYNFSATKFKLFLPTQALKISFALKGLLSGEKTVKAPASAGKNFKNVYPTRDADGNPIASNIGLQFTRDTLFQRDVEVAIEDIDKQGTFFGSLFFNRTDFSQQLLEGGHVKLHHKSAEKMPSYESMKKIEERLRREKKGVWWNFDEEAEAQRIADLRAAREEARGERDVKTPTKSKFLVTITEIMTGSTFFFQIADEETKTFMEDLMEDFQTRGWQDRPTYAPEKKKEWVAGKFSVDGNWYRAEVLNIITKEGNPEKEYELRYVDYGNTEVVTSASIRALDEEFKTTPAQARKGKLAYIKAPTLDAEFGDDAAALLKELAWGKTLLANLQYTEGPQDDAIHHVWLGDEETHVNINGALVIQGLASVESKRKSRIVNPKPYEELLVQENTARSSRLCIWQYGAVPDSDEERQWANMLR